jgi:hypothetical protein
MQEPTIRVPMICPACAKERLYSLSVAASAAAPRDRREPACRGPSPVEGCAIARAILEPGDSTRHVIPAPPDARVVSTADHALVCDARSTSKALSTSDRRRRLKPPPTCSADCRSKSRLMELPANHGAWAVGVVLFASDLSNHAVNSWRIAPQYSNSRGHRRRWQHAPFTHTPPRGY